MSYAVKAKEEIIRKLKREREDIACKLASIDASIEKERNDLGFLKIPLEEIEKDENLKAKRKKYDEHEQHFKFIYLSNIPFPNVSQDELKWLRTSEAKDIMKTMDPYDPYIDLGD